MSVEDLAARLVAAARETGGVVATAESCTGGLIAGAITGVAGSSAAFDRGFVTYSNAAKREMLGVADETLGRYGAVSEETAGEMAAGALSRSDATLAVSVTGIAGPGGGSIDKPVGLVRFGFATAAGVETRTMRFGDIGRAAIRRRTVETALEGLIARL